jgi:hypothetical protein
VQAFQFSSRLGTEAKFIFHGLKFRVRIPDLFDCPRTSDKDVHQSRGALLPVRAGRHVSDADESLQGIDRVEVPTYVAAFDTALYESTNYFMDWRVGSFNHLRVAPTAAFSAGAIIFFVAM